MLIIAHRGASAHAPENTRAAFDLAIEMGSSMIETDVHLSRDGVLVLIHDDLVDHTTNGHGPVADHDLNELLALDAGGWYGPDHAGERMPTLQAFCDDYLPRIPVCLEIKEPFATDPLIAFLKEGDQGIWPRLQVTSFSWQAIRRANAALDIPCGYLSRTFDRDIIDRCARLGLAQVCPPAKALDAGLVAYAHDQELVVRAWGISSMEDVDRVYATGADGATTNWPEWMTGHPSRNHPA